ncbi:MAG: SpoIIE family protein phosphatase [Bacteroidales bacterium]|nr:SpoIIE family protein phosphatase [Bacteroidales bacterium]MBQ3677780.1 SpoIIE family protein phosphatase [Bacteroidales bacterium]MBQ4214886.1 SpoIIE family protein phosphatase [Bacteroidales bacterium]MBR4689229.1 SpoIIE family protein phosphatase [Bacteroidales bacterium]MBR7034742.1 SpoIIE family protein phosphatase [Bacteroidales bacterium]
MIRIDQSQQQQLELAQFKLKSLLDITLAINANCSAHDLLQKYRDILCQGLNIRVISVFIVSQNWRNVLSAGVPETFGSNADEVSSALSRFSDITRISDSNEPLLRYFDVVIPVFHKDIQLAYVLLGDITGGRLFGDESPVFSNLDFIQTLANIVAVALENKRLYKQALEQESLKKELEVASKLQAMLIPSPDSLPKNEFLDIATFYQPHSMVGGDYYDFMKLNANEYGFCIADVSGKGISAAILMSNFQANLRILFQRSVPLINLIKDLNQNVNKNSQGERFVTFFIGKYNVRNKVLYYVNAGHNPPLLFKKEYSELMYLTSGCVGLGMLEEIPRLKVGSVHIGSGDKLLCFTDGLIEAENELGKAFGTIPIEGALTIDGSAADVVHYLRSELEQFIGTAAVNDDVSIMGIDFL